MSALENILGMLPDRVSSGKQDQIFTPPHIAKEMVNALPEDVWNRYTTFFDPICKSGIFLYEIYQKLMESADLIETFPDKQDRREHIVKNQLFGIAVDQICQMMSIRAVYGYLEPDSHIILLNEYELIMRNADKTFLYKTLKERFNTVQFGVVIGNPPYNKDAYLDFVQLGHNLSTKYTCMITPAKWQAKGGKKNEDFRREIVPYMEKIVFYPDARDIFDIDCQGGISHYTVGKNLTINKELVNKCNKNKGLDSTETRSISVNNENVLLNKAFTILNKINATKPLHFETKITDKFGVYILSVFMQGANMLNTGNTLLLGKSHTEDRTQYSKGGSEKELYTSNSVDECKSFESYIQTKFVRFLCWLSVCQQNISDSLWRFVPATEAFDHIFTDAELYEKYNLTSEEINIIESVIKERK